MKTTDFSRFLERFFLRHLTDVRGSSPKTIDSYRKSFALYLEFMEVKKSIDPDKIAMADFTSESVLEFLDWLEKDKANGIATRNLRLAAIRSFVRFVLCNFPECLKECQAILGIPVKKSAQKAISYLDSKGVELLAKQVNLHTRDGQRDYLILALLYSMGLRVSELTGLRVKDIHFGDRSRMLVHGKGGKGRYVPILKAVAPLIRNHLENMGYDERVDGSEPLFKNHMGTPFTRQGIAYIVKKYGDKARKENPSLIPVDLSPHKLRHTSAMGMLAAGMDLIYIRDILGHTSVVTTEVYARADEEMKRAAIEKASAKVLPSEVGKWKKDKKLRDWLKSFSKSYDK